MSYVPPKKNTQFIFYVELASQSDAHSFQTNPTLASGDVTVSIDGGTAANLSTLPTVTPSGGRRVKVTLSAAEMNGDNIVVVFSDQAGAEWDELGIHLQTVTTNQIDDLATQVTAINIKDKTDTLPFGSDFAAYFDAVPTATENANATLDATASSHNTTGTIGAKINAASASAGAGAISTTVTINNASNQPLDGAEVWVTTDVGGTNVVASGQTNTSGQVTFMLDAGTYYTWCQLARHNFSNPNTLTVS